MAASGTTTNTTPTMSSRLSSVWKPVAEQAATIITSHPQPLLAAPPPMWWPAEPQQTLTFQTVDEKYSALARRWEAGEPVHIRIVVMQRNTWHALHAAAEAAFEAERAQRPPLRRTYSFRSDNDDDVFNDVFGDDDDDDENSVALDPDGSYTTVDIEFNMDTAKRLRSSSSGMF